ncbi:MAG: ABC transporter ATP-binding protein/permease [Actinomycetota bacterium]|nr:ABC transporter ATP-binding protein/permease [Actinomycetota bacterium]
MRGFGRPVGSGFHHWHDVLARDPEAIAGAKLDRAVVRRVWAFARPYRWMLLGFVAAILVSTVVSVLPPLVFRAIIDHHAIPRRDLAGLNRLALLAVGLALAELLLNLFQRWWAARIGEGLIFDLRSALYEHVNRMPLAFFTRTQTGALISRLNNDVQGAQRAFTTTLGSIVQNVLGVVVTLAVMIRLEWRLTLLALVVVPAFILPAKRVGRRLQRLTKESYNLTAAMNTNMTERFNVSGALLVKLFGNPDREMSEFADKAGRVRDIGVKTAVLGRVFFASLGLLGAVGTVLVYWLGTRQVIDGALSVGTLTALALYVARLYGPLTQLTNAQVDVMTAFVSFERVFEVLDASSNIVESPGAYDLVEPQGRIEFDNVWFRYPAPSTVSISSLEADASAPLSDEPSAVILKGISFSAEPGQMVALVGPTGAGKSTLCNLVPRLYDVTAGAVLIDGHDVRDLTTASLAAAIGMVTQDPHLFHETIATNLRYAKPDASDEELVAACEAARIHDLIARLPDGYETIVGERGYRLSGGEKQRLALARVLLKSPAIVILDEATAHLDSETELLVQQALAEALSGRTSLVIAHRLSTVQAADQILVLDEGRIVERGTHAQLVERAGLYRELYLTQYARPASRPAAPTSGP